MFSYKLGDRERSRERFLRGLRKIEQEERRAANEAEKRRARKRVYTDYEYPTTHQVRMTYAQAYTHSGRRPPVETPAPTTTTELDPKRVSCWRTVNKVMWLVFWFYPYASQSCLSENPDERERDNAEGTPDDTASYRFYARERNKLWEEKTRKIEMEELFYKEFSEHLELNGQCKFDVTLRKFEAYKRVRNSPVDIPLG